jgi:hypothetical protein
MAYLAMTTTESQSASNETVHLDSGLRVCIATVTLPFCQQVFSPGFSNLVTSSCRQGLVVDS